MKLSSIALRGRQSCRLQLDSALTSSSFEPGVAALVGEASQPPPAPQLPQILERSGAGSQRLAQRKKELVALLQGNQQAAPRPPGYRRWHQLHKSSSVQGLIAK